MKCDELKRHRPDIMVLGEGKALAVMADDPMGVWCHIQDVRDILDEKDKEIAELKAANKLLKEHIANGDVSRITWIDEVIELKDKCQMHDFFWEGCGFAKRGFKNTIAVSEAFDKLEAENAELKQKLENVQASAYAESVDAGMRERRLRRSLYKACVNWAHFAIAFFSSYATKEKWHKMERKCLNKMEEYK